MKSFRQLLAVIISVSFFSSIMTQPALADIPYVNSGSVSVSIGSPFINIFGLVGQSSCTVASSTGAGIVAVEVSQDGITWTALNITQPSGATAMTLTLPGVGTSAVAAFANARAHLTTGAGGAVYFACGAGVGFGASVGGGGSVIVTNFPNPQNVNLTQVGGATLGAATAAGTSATGNILGVQGVTGGIPIATSVTFPSTIGVTQSTTPWTVGGTTGTLTQTANGLKVDGSAVTQPISGTVTANAGTGFPSTTAAGTSGSSLVTVQGSASGVPIPVSGTITATTAFPYSGTTDAQTATTSSVVGLGAFNGTTYDRVRVSAPGTSIATAGVLGVQGVTGGVNLPVAQVNTESLANSLVATSTANFVSDTIANGYGTTVIVITGTWTGTLRFQGTVDGTTFFSLYAIPLPQFAQGTVETVTANGQWTLNVNGLSAVRVSVSTAGTGTAIVNFSNSQGTMFIQGSGPSGVLYVATQNGSSVQTTFVQAGNADAQSAGNFSGVDNYGYNGTSWDRIRVSTVGTSIGAGVGALGVQGITGGVPLPISGTITATTSQPYSGTTDGQTATVASVVGLGTFNGTTYDRVRSSAPGTSITTAGVLGVQGVTGGVALNVSSTPSANLSSFLTSASATGCTSLEVNTTGQFLGMISAANVGQTAVLTLFNEGTSPTCAAADQIYSIQLGASQIITMPSGGIPLSAGLAYTLSVSLTSGQNITVLRK